MAALNDGGLVLLVEDNEVNQFVAVHLLEKNGLRVDVAANGRLALDMWLSRSYKAVFMDCHMPEVDGYQTTAEIRRREGAGRRVPIIAMTADVMNGGRDRCLAAGMDDFIAKPIDPEILTAAIARFSLVDGEVTSLLDRSVLDSICDGDTQMRLDLLGLFADRSHGVLVEMWGALKASDPSALRSCADRLKRSTASVGALRMVALCERLLQIADRGLLSEASALVEELERASRLTRAVW